MAAMANRAGSGDPMGLVTLTGMAQGPITTGARQEGDEPPDSRADPELIGRLIAGKYKIEKFLGGGAMGAVYRARFAALEKNVAVKVMHRAVAVDPNFVGRFHREAKAASRLDHPNSMRVIDFGEEPDGLLYIAMEYVEGRDLYRVIHDDWPISNADIADILMQALAAIAVAHEMGVIHRDLKPENLMILRAKNDEEKDAYLVKVCDFGIAKITEKDEDPAAAAPPGTGGGPVAGGQKLTTQGLVVGTPEYMSPEQARGEKLDPRSDIYSIGVILYQLLTGRTPFAGDTALAVVLKHITEQPPAPSVHYAGVHKGLEAITLKALSKDRNDRFQTARAMRNAIRETLEGRPMPAGRPTESDAETAVDLGSGSSLPGTGPVPVVIAGGAQVGSGPMVVPSTTAPSMTNAPSVAGGSGGPTGGSLLTPLGTAAATGTSLEGPKRSSAGLFVGIALGALLVGGGGVAAYLRSEHGPTAGKQLAPDPSSPQKLQSHAVPPHPTTPKTPTSPTSSPSSAQPPIAPDATTHTVDPKHPKGTPTGHNAVNAKVAVEPPPSVPVAAPPPPTQEPPPPPVTVAPPPPPPPVVVAPPAAPAFNPATCRAAVGQVRSNGATTARSLTMNGTPGVWTSCAQRSIRERPAGPIAGTVHIMFTDNKGFRGASCAACPAALAQCIASNTQRSVAIDFKGEVTGEPAFDVPVTFSCD